MSVAPNFQNLKTNETPLGLLAAKVEGKRPLGLVRVGTDEILVIYDGKYSVPLYIFPG